MYGSLRCAALTVNERMFPFHGIYSVNPFSRDLPVPDIRRNRLRLIMDVLKLHFVFLIDLMAIDLISYIKVV